MKWHPGFLQPHIALQCRIVSYNTIQFTHYIFLLYQAVSKCWSYLLVTDIPGPHVRMYKRLLQRSGENVPDFLEKLALRYMEGQAIGATKPLCNKLKMFGECR